MADEKVVIKVQMGNFAVEVTGLAEYAEKKVEELIQKYSSFRAASSPLKATDVKVDNKVKAQSPSEYIKKISPKNQTEKALVLAYYLEKSRNMENFSTSDLIDITAEAKQPRFSNISDIVARLVQQGLLMGAGEKDNKRAFVLTTTGEEMVDDMVTINHE